MGPLSWQAWIGLPRFSQDSKTGPKTLSLEPDAGTGGCEHSGSPPGLTSPTTLSPASLSGLGLHLAKNLLPHSPCHSHEGHLLPLPGPLQAWRTELWPGNLREARVTSRGWGQMQSGSLPQFPPPGDKPCQLGGSVCGTESCSTGLSGSTPAAGVETLLQKLIVSFPGLSVQLREQPQASKGEPRPG